MRAVQPIAVIMVVLTVPFFGIASMSVTHHWLTPVAEVVQRQSPLQALPAVERKITDY